MNPEQTAWLGQAHSGFPTVWGRLDAPTVRHYWFSGFLRFAGECLESADITVNTNVGLKGGGVVVI